MKYSLKKLYFPAVLGGFFLELIEDVSLLKTHKRSSYMIGLLLYIYIL